MLLLLPMFEVKVAPSTGEARAELESVLASTLFVRSPRLSRLLEYLCIKYLEGATEEVKEYQIGVEVLGRPPSFEWKRTGCGNGCASITKRKAERTR